MCAFQRSRMSWLRVTYSRSEKCSRRVCWGGRSATRPWIQPNEAFLQQLADFEEALAQSQLTPLPQAEVAGTGAAAGATGDQGGHAPDLGSSHEPAGAAGAAEATEAAEAAAASASRRRATGSVGSSGSS